jgi:signal transduction histidine kinase
LPIATITCNYLNNPNAGFTIGKPVMSRLVSRWRFNLMRPLNQPGKSFDGLIAAAFEVDYYKRFLGQASLGPRGRIILVRNDGVPLVVQPYVDNVYQTDFKKTRMFQEMQSRKQFGTYNVAGSAVDNANRIISYHQLSRFPVVAIVSLHEQDILEPWVRKAYIQSSLTLGLCILILILTRTMFRHLDQLQVMQAELDKRSALLAASVNEQRIILNNVSVGIGFVRNRIVQWSNAPHDRTFGFEPGSTKGMNTSSFYADADECRRIGEAGYGELAGGGIFSTETTMKRADGTLFPCLLSGQAVDPEKPGDGSIWVIQDLTDIKRGEIERLSLLEEVQHARHLENLGTLAGGIAHDFNNLLMVIQGATDLSIMKLEMQSQAQPYLEKIALATQSAAELCQKMLAYSGKGLYQLEKMHLKTLLCPIYEQLRATLFGAPVELVLNIPDDLSHIKADPNQLRQAVTSVINNAVEAIGNRRGSISISGYSEGEAPGKNVIIEVTDTGCGMDEDTLRRVFDPFFSTKFTGRGLDMSAVSGVVKALNGTIDIKSRQGEGTSVRFAIPACEDEIIVVAVDDVPRRHEPEGKPTVLFVDDEELLREMAGNLLEALGYEVVIADSGREALRIYAERGHSIDLLMLDMTMPEIGGAEVLHELRLRGSKVPVLLSSGYSRENVASKIAADELTAFIQKPYSVESLRSVLGEVFARI